MPKIELGVNPSLARGVQKICDEWKGVSVLSGNPIKTTVIDAESEGTVFLLSEENRSAMSRLGRINEASFEIFVDELAQRRKLGLRERVNVTDRWNLTVFSFNVKIVFSMRRKRVSFLLREDIGKLVVLGRESREVGFLGGGSATDDIARGGPKSVLGRT
jgi:hypothetical protein